MSVDLLSYLMSPAGPSDVQIGAARDLVAARVLAKKADEGHPHARAFVQSAQETLAQAKVRRLRADRLRAGAAKASTLGFHDLARMGAEAAAEETREAAALEANVVSAVRSTHAPAAMGYYDSGEQRMLKRKAFEDNLSSAARENLMSKLLTQLYDSGSAQNESMGEEGDIAEDLSSYLHVAAESFGGDLDSVFGADAAERINAVLGATVRQLRKQAGLAVLPPAVVALRKKRKAAGLKVMPANLKRKQLAIAFGEDSEAKAWVLRTMELTKDGVLPAPKTWTEGLSGGALALGAKVTRWVVDHVVTPVKAGQWDSLVLAGAAAHKGAIEAEMEKADTKDRAQVSEAIERVLKLDGSSNRSLRLRSLSAKCRIKAAKAASAAMGYAEDAREAMDAAEGAMLDRAVDYGADDAVATMLQKLKTLPTKRVLAISNDLFRKKAVRAAAKAELARRLEEGDEDALSPQAKRLRVMTEKFKAMSDARVLAIAKDPLRRKDVRVAARAELARREKAADATDASPGEVVESEEVESDSSSSSSAAVPPPAYSEEGYLDSYKGITPGRKRFVKFFDGRAAKLGAEDAATLALTEEAQDNFGGFFEALGEFFRNLFSVGGRDAKRISSASRAAKAAGSQKEKELSVPEEAKALSEARLKKLKFAFSKADTEADRSRIQAKIDKLRPSLRAKRAEVRQAEKAAFDASFDASRPGHKGKAEAAPAAPSAGFPITGDPILKQGMKDEGAGGSVSQHQVEVLQQFLNAAQHAELEMDGKFGPKTKKALIAFQTKNSLAPDGKVGPATASVIAAQAGSENFGLEPGRIMAAVFTAGLSEALRLKIRDMPRLRLKAISEDVWRKPKIRRAARAELRRRGRGRGNEGGAF